MDIRHVLPAIRVPTLVLHRADDAYREVDHGRYLAAHIPGSKYVELPGRDHLPYVGDQDAVLDEVEEFLTGVRRGPEPDRVLATVLFTDIVGSTERAAKTGDRHWRSIPARLLPSLRSHHAPALNTARESPVRKRLHGSARERRRDLECQRPAVQVDQDRRPDHRPHLPPLLMRLRTETLGSAGRTVLSLRVTLASDQRPSR